MAQLVDIKKDFDLGNRFLLDVAENLASILDNSFRVIVKYDLQDYKFPKDDKKNILFALSRETHDLPRYVDEDSVFMIFHNYSILDNWGYPVNHPKVFPLPLGNFIDDINEKVEEIKPIGEREYDFCFVGQIPNTGTRDKFKKNLDHLLENCDGKYKHYVKYTSAFGTGLDHDEYIDLLNNSKICLCPTGAFSDESFRFFEAISMGSFPMVERLPKFWYYEEAPLFFCPWQFLDKHLALSLNLLHSSKDLVPFKAIAQYNNTILDPVYLSELLKKIIDEKQEYTNKLQDSL